MLPGADLRRPRSSWPAARAGPELASGARRRDGCWSREADHHDRLAERLLAELAQPRIGRAIDPGTRAGTGSPSRGHRARVATTRSPRSSARDGRGGGRRAPDEELLPGPDRGRRPAAGRGPRRARRLVRHAPLPYVEVEQALAAANRLGDGAGGVRLRSRPRRGAGGRPPPARRRGPRRRRPGARPGARVEPRSFGGTSGLGGHGDATVLGAYVGTRIVGERTRRCRCSGRRARGARSGLEARDQVEGISWRRPVTWASIACRAPSGVAGGDALGDRAVSLDRARDDDVEVDHVELLEHRDPRVLDRARAQRSGAVARASGGRSCRRAGRGRAELAAARSSTARRSSSSASGVRRSAARAADSGSIAWRNSWIASTSSRCSRRYSRRVASELGGPVTIAPPAEPRRISRYPRPRAPAGPRAGHPRDAELLGVLAPHGRQLLAGAGHVPRWIARRRCWTTTA